jgi:hypothetical protein
MKTTTNPILNSVLIRIVFAQLFLFLIIFTSFGQGTQKNDTGKNFEDEWWIPILVKHKAEMKGSNNFKNIFEMGETNSVKDGIATITNAFVILRDKSGNYSIIESQLLTHDFNKELIITNEGTMKVYRKDSKPTEPITIIQIKKMELKFPRNQ